MTDTLAAAIPTMLSWLLDMVMMTSLPRTTFSSKIHGALPGVSTDTLELALKELQPQIPLMLVFVQFTNTGFNHTIHELD